MILCNYAFNISEDEIHDMNKTLYRNFRAYTEAKCAFVIAEEIKAIKMNKISETYKSKEKNSGAANFGNNKKNNKDHQSNSNSSVDKTLPRRAHTAGRIVTFQLNTLKTCKGRATKLNQ